MRVLITGGAGFIGQRLARALLGRGKLVGASGKPEPVENEHSSVHSHATIAAISSTVPKRPMGIFESMKSMCCWVICANMPVFTAAGVTQFTRIPVFASSLPSDLVSEMTPALEAL